MEMKRTTSKIHYLEPTLMAAAGISVQGFTTRHEGVSRPPYNSLNLGTNTLDSPHNIKGNRSLLARSFGGTLDRLVTVTQVHGTDLLIIDTPNPDLAHFLKVECDGIITNQPGAMIGICVADCFPILLLDPAKGVAAALHAGWKGTARGIVRKGVEAMAEVFGSRPADIIAAIGPGIGACCYEVDAPVKAEFTAGGFTWDLVATPAGEGKWLLDLAEANRQQLMKAGLQERHVEVAADCVSCNADVFFSYRRDKGDTGRQMGFIMIR